MPLPTSEPVEVLVRPGADAWRAALERRAGGTAGEAAAEFRRELGLPIDKPIVMSGHQPTLWHPGILAKWIAMVAAAEKFGARAAWLVVDHDAVEPWRVRLPVKKNDGTLVAREFDLAGAAATAGSAGSAQPVQSEIPAVAKPVASARAPAMVAGEVLALPCVVEGVARMVESGANIGRSTSASEHVTRATLRLIHDGVLKGKDEPLAVMATSLLRTRAARLLMERMAQDPARCVTAYNEAVALHRGAGVRPLDSDGDDAESPLWVIEDGKRRGVRARELAGLLESARAGMVTLAPKALFMTLLVRLYGCELFIHGLGGGGASEGAGYDEVMQEWATRWLGSVTLTPMATVTATLRLDFGGGVAVTEEEARHATWTAWHARNDPAMLGDEAAAARKMEMARALRGFPKRSPQRRAAYVEMRAMLDRVREAGASTLERLKGEAAALRERAMNDAVRAERTWPFPVYTREALRGLVKSVGERFASGGGVS